MFKSPTGKQINSIGSIVHIFTTKYNPHMTLTYYKIRFATSCKVQFALQGRSC